MCYDEDRINGVYLSLHRRDDAAPPPQRKPLMPQQSSIMPQLPYLHPSPHPSTLPSQLPYSQPSGDYLPPSRYAPPLVRNGPPYSSPGYDPRRLPLPESSKRPRTGSQSGGSYAFPQPSLTQSPLTKTSPAMSRGMSPALTPPFPHDPAGMYLSQRPTGYSVTPSPRPSPSMGVGGGSFPRGVGGLSEVRRTQVAGSGDGGKK